jgi:hypothetical protein
MTLPVTIPNTFANATTSIPLANLDANFVTIYDAVNGIGNGAESLANVSITGGTASNVTVEFAAGTNAAPSITTVGDTNTGIFFPAADTIAFAEGGVEAMRITSAGEVLINTTTAISGEAGHLTIQNSLGPFINLLRSDTVVGTGNDMGTIAFYGTDTTGNTPTKLAYIEAQASGDHGAGDNPTDLVFATTPDGSATVAEVARFTESKYLRFASGTGGIQFGGDTAAANALDDYEEGTWTPVIADASTGGNVSATAPTAAIYTKVGRLVTVFCSFANIDTTGLTAGNDLHIRNLPFTAASTGGVGLMGGVCATASVTFTGLVNPVVFDNTTYFRFGESISGVGLDYLLVSEFSDDAADIYINITYQAA